MSKKKTNGLLGKLKGKFSKNAEEEILEEELDQVEENDQEEELQFADSEDDEDLEEALLAGSSDDTEEVVAEDDDEDEEVDFVANELKIDDAEKKVLEELEDAPLLHEGEGQNPLEVEGLDHEQTSHEFPQDVEDEEDQEYETEEAQLPPWQDEYEEMPMPGQSNKDRFFAALSGIKSKAQSLLKKKGDSIEGNRLQSLSNKNPMAIKDLNWDELVSSLFSPTSRKHIHKGFIIALFSVATYYTGKGIALYLLPKESSKSKLSKSMPKAPSTNYRAATNIIKRANLFNARTQEGELPARKNQPVVEQPKVCKIAKKSSKLPFKLINTIVLQDTVKSVASVQVRGGKKLTDIREGEKLDKLAEIGRIERLKVVFKNLKSGECEYIETKRKGSRLKPIKVVSEKRGKKLLTSNRRDGITQQGNKFKIKNKVREELLSNMSKVLTQARAVQIKNPDGTLSFKMTEIVPGSIYSQLDIQEEDVISAINGKKFTNLNDLMSLFGRIRDIPQFSITKKRDGAETTVDYNFEN